MNSHMKKREKSEWIIVGKEYFYNITYNVSYIYKYFDYVTMVLPD